jgi:hypothetical protein
MLISEQVRLANVVSAKAQVRKIASELEQTSVGEKIAKKTAKNRERIRTNFSRRKNSKKTAKNRERIRTNFSRRKNSEKSRAN